jgi:branched-chain amino acid transport system substrate-binding protein
MYVSDLSVGSKLLGYRVGLGAWRPVRRSAAFQPAFAVVQLSSSVGQIRLDQGHQAVGAVYFGRYQGTGGGGVVLRPLRVVPNFDEIFDGCFRTSGPLPGRRYPPCSNGNPPPWAGSG